MAEETAPPTDPAKGGSTFTQLAVLIGLVTGVLNLVVWSAWASTWFEISEASQTFAGGVLAGSAVVTLGIPVVLSWVLIGSLKERGYKVKGLRTTGGILVLWNIAALVIASQVSSMPLPELLQQRGAWMPMTLAGKSFTLEGEAALPHVRDKLGSALDKDDLGELTPLLANESAAALAVQQLMVFELLAPVLPAKTKDAYTALTDEHGIDRALIREAPIGLRASTSDTGRELLSDVLAVRESIVGVIPVDDRPASFQWILVMTARQDLVLAEPDAREQLIDNLQGKVLAPDRVALVLSSEASVEGRLEDGAWRLHIADFEGSVEIAERRLKRLEKVIEGMERVSPDDTDPPQDPDTDEASDEGDAKDTDDAQEVDHPDVREAVRGAALGRYGFMTGTTAYYGDWPGSLTRGAAVTQSARVLTWCTHGHDPDNPADPILAKELADLVSKYGLTDASEAWDTAKQKTLQPRGREFLAEVLQTCAPVARAAQSAQEDAGNPVSDTRRMAWAERDADALLQDAVITDVSEGEVSVASGSIQLTVRQQDGEWRVDWVK